MKKLLFLILVGLLPASCSSSPAPTQPALIESPAPTATLQTPPQPIPATETFTPIPTFTSTPYPMYFTEEFDADLAAWDFFQTGGVNLPTARLENSLLRIDIASPHTWYYAIHAAHDYSNVTVSAKVDGSPAGSLGLVCFYNEEEGWYEFNIASDGTYNALFGQWLAEGIAQYIPLAGDPASTLAPGGLNYEISLTCQKDALFVSINGNTIRRVDVARYGLVAGKIGIAAASFEQIPMSAVFDWVRVSEK